MSELLKHVIGLSNKLACLHKSGIVVIIILELKMAIVCFGKKKILNKQLYYDFYLLFFLNSVKIFTQNTRMGIIKVPFELNFIYHQFSSVGIEGII